MKNFSVISFALVFLAGLGSLQALGAESPKPKPSDTPKAKTSKTEDLLLKPKVEDPNKLKPEDTLLGQHPALAKFFPPLADDHIKFGFGIAPVELLHSSTAMELSFFQMHWILPNFDWEILNASFNLSFSSDPRSEVRSFTFRTSPKWRIIPSISVGPMVGLEFVSFPNVLRQLRNDTTTYQTQHFEPFSGVGPIYGGELTETFHWGTFEVRLCQMVYQQTYRSSGTSGDWYYYFQDSDLNSDQKPLAPGTVFLFEISLLY